MSERVRARASDFKRLCRMSCKRRKSYLKNCDRDLIDCICECCKNILLGNVQLTQTRYNKLRKYKKALRKLSTRKTSVKTRRKLLQQSGGFLGALVPTLIGLASSLFV